MHVDLYADIRRKSCGVNRSGRPLASVMLVPFRASLTSSRMAGPPIGRVSPPKRRWNSSGIGGFQMRSW